jgi:hypothetical protein
VRQQLAEPVGDILNLGHAHLAYVQPRTNETLPHANLMPPDLPRRVRQAVGGLCGRRNEADDSSGGRTWHLAGDRRRLIGVTDGRAQPIGVTGGGSMDFSGGLDALQRRVAEAKEAVQNAATESRQQLRSRIDQTQVELERAGTDAQRKADQAAADARSTWAQMRADASAKMQDLRTKIDKRNRELDAKDAAGEADWAEGEAADALDFADWAVRNAQLAILDAIDARAQATELAKAAGS